MQEQKFLEDKWTSEALRKELSEQGYNEEQLDEIVSAQENQANALAQKIYRKNKREIDRLTKHASVAVLENNLPAYEYAIKKVRTILRQPFNDEIIVTGWQTTRAQVWELLNAKTS